MRAERVLRPPRNSVHHPEETVSARDYRPHYEVFGGVLPALASRTQGSQLCIYCIINLILVGNHFHLILVPSHFQPYLVSIQDTSGARERKPRLLEKPPGAHPGSGQNLPGKKLFKDRGSAKTPRTESCRKTLSQQAKSQQP